MALKIALNCERLDFCVDRVNMWVRDPVLAKTIEEKHENPKYLPGITLPHNLAAVTDLAEAVQGATLLIFVVPHQYLPNLLPTIRDNIEPGACRGVSLIKGLGKSNRIRSVVHRDLHFLQCRQRLRGSSSSHRVLDCNTSCRV